MLQERHEYYTSGDFDFGNDASENIYLHPYINSMASERLQGAQQFHSKNCLLEMPHFHVIIHWKWYHKNSIL